MLFSAGFSVRHRFACHRTRARQRRQPSAGAAAGQVALERRVAARTGLQLGVGDRDGVDQRPCIGVAGAVEDILGGASIHPFVLRQDTCTCDPVGRCSAPQQIVADDDETDARSALRSASRYDESAPATATFEAPNVGFVGATTVGFQRQAHGSRRPAGRCPARPDAWIAVEMRTDRAATLATRSFRPAAARSDDRPTALHGQGFSCDDPRRRCASWG